MARNPNPEKKRYSRIAPLYDVMEFIPEKLAMGRWRQQLIRGNVDGLVLEIGVGTGKNLSFYTPNQPLVAVDISTAMLRRARKKAPPPGEVRFVVANAQALPFRNKVFRTVVTTFVFCSVSEPVTGLKEIRRVMTSRGRALFLEHMRPAHPLLGFFFDLMNPLVVRIWGANINRRTVENIRKAGLHLKQEINLWSDIVKRMVVQANKG